VLTLVVFAYEFHLREDGTRGVASNKDPSGELALSTVVGGFTAFLIAWGYYSTTITIDLIADGCRDILDTAGCYNLNLNDQHYTAKYLSCQNTEKDCHALMIKEGAGIYGLPGLF
jgi:hypothetical protein